MRQRLLLCASIFFLCGQSTRADSAAAIDSPMYKAPDLPRPPVEMIFPDGAVELWLKALARPEVELKCKAAESIARAKRQGVKGLDAAVAPLKAALDEAEQHPGVRLAVAKALIALDARESAPSLLQQAQAGTSDLREMIEPALARWDYQPARAVWLARLSDAGTRPCDLVLAIRGLGTVREEQAFAPLHALLFNPRATPAHRLEAAHALARLRSSGLEKDAAELAATAQPVTLLSAAAMLQKHTSDAAIALLQRLAGGNEPAAAALAAGRLLAIDAKLVLPALDAMLASPDATVRSLAVDSLFRLPTEKHLGQLGQRLNDAAPEVRTKARRYLLELAGKKELHDLVITEASKALATQHWRALEQAAILLAQLDHKPAAKRFVELLTFERPEVFVAAAWGLRKLNIADTLPAVAAHITARLRQLSAQRDATRRKALPFDMIDHELSQLNQFLGQQKYKSADALLQRFVPQPQMGSIGHESRAGAIWALGMIHEGQNVPDLATALEGRLNHTAMPIPPEDKRVRWMSAIALGRMKAKQTLASVRKHYVGEASDDPVSNACGWSIEQITGEKMPAPRTIRKMEQGWFLVPRGQ